MRSGTLPASKPESTKKRKTTLQPSRLRRVGITPSAASSVEPPSARESRYWPVVSQWAERLIFRFGPAYQKGQDDALLVVNHSAFHPAGHRDDLTGDVTR